MKVLERIFKIREFKDSKKKKSHQYYKADNLPIDFHFLFPSVFISKILQGTIQLYDHQWASDWKTKLYPAFRVVLSFLLHFGLLLADT